MDFVGEADSTERKAYWTFKECLNDNKHKKSEFAYAFGKFEDDPEVFEENMDVFYHPTELAMYQMLEDEFYCSGMCQKSLFYFSHNITYGPPRETCLFRFHEWIAQRAGAYSLSLLMAGLCMLILFFMFPGMLFRPLKGQENQNSGSGQQEFNVNAPEFHPSTG